MTQRFSRYAAIAGTLALAAFVVGCPGGGNPTTTNPTTAPTKKPTSSPSSSATGTPGPSPSGTAKPGSPSPTPSASASSSGSPSPSPSASGSPAGATYKQVERLARPAINEGLIRANDLLNTWNAVGPDVDSTTAAKPIVDEATATLKALGNTDTQVATLFKQLVPDVMRIDTTKTSGYATSFGNADPLALDNLSPTNLIPVGGRMITDDVMDVTMILIVPGGLPGDAAVDGLESDGVAYADHHKPVLTSFPYLPEPN